MPSRVRLRRRLGSGPARRCWPRGTLATAGSASAQRRAGAPRRAAPAPRPSAARDSSVRISPSARRPCPLRRAGARMPDALHRRLLHRRRQARAAPGARSPAARQIAARRGAAARAGRSAPRRARRARRPRTPSATPSERAQPLGVGLGRLAAAQPRWCPWAGRDAGDRASGPAATAASVRRPSAGAGTGARPRQTPPKSASERASEEARNRAAYEARQRRAAERRAEAATQAIRRMSSKNPAAPLPAPSAASAAKPLARQASGSTRTSASDRLSPPPRARWRALPTSISVASRGGSAWTMAPSSCGVK